MLGLTFEIACDASAAVTVFAFGCDVEAAFAQHCDDRLIRRHIKDLAGAFDLDLERRVFRSRPVFGGFDIFAVHIIGRPGPHGVLRRRHEARGTAIIEGCADLEIAERLADIEALGGVATVGLHTADSGTGEGSRALVDSLRSDRPPFESWVVGQASGIVDFRAAVPDRAPWAVGAVVLSTLVLLFGFQGEQILAQPLIIAMLAVPILIQVYFNSGLAYLLNRAAGEAHCVAGPSALIGASNFFELAVATAIAVMHATRTLHPPGGATALIAVIGGKDVHELGFLFVLVPGALGPLLLLAVALAVSAVAGTAAALHVGEVAIELLGEPRARFSAEK